MSGLPISKSSISESELIQKLITNLVQIFCKNDSKHRRLMKFVTRIIGSRLSFSMIQDESTIVQMINKYGICFKDDV